MTQEQLKALSAPIADIYESLTDELMQNIACRLVDNDKITDTAKWQIAKLIQAGKLNKENLAIIAKFTADCSDITEAILYDAAYFAISELEPSLQAAAKAGLISNTTIPASQRLTNALALYQKQANDTLNLVNTVMAYKAKMAYTQIINKTAELINRDEYLKILGKNTASVVTGQQSRTSALRQCIKEFSQKGLPGFVDKSGREWSPEAYINMDIRTTVNNVAHEAQFSRMDDYGCDLIEVSSHVGARPLCEPYQGKVFSMAGKSGIVEDLDGNSISYSPWGQTSYGKPAGLLGINCGHQIYPFFPGRSRQTYKPYEKKNNDKVYAESQKQRYLERQVRKSRRECIMLDTVGDKDGFKQASVFLKQREQALKQFTLNTNRMLKTDRIQTPGFNRSVSGKAVQANKAFTKEQKHAKMVSEKNTRELIKADQTVKKINVGHQSKHLLDSRHYQEGRSYLYGDLSLAQDLVNRYAGTGEIKFTLSGNWSKKEVITLSENIGVNVDPKSSKHSETNRFTIHYGKNGTHLVPTKRKE